ncbi:hypothetical protein IFM89_005000 [Coptis chinensis]|uniref:Uncharacterized protein n=1 Tax=Coptis chinensis TaxID=261450 RepID=A0A835LUP7_9MAGN|nr:hypothetical protein IFM89_005000 [Coptis chinensis]
MKHTEAMMDVIDLMEEVEMEDIMPKSVRDIDCGDSENPLAVVEYVEDIYSFYKSSKLAKDPANPPFQTDIFMATCTMKNGSFVLEEVREKMIFGKDGNGRVLGLGSGVSKTTFMAGSPYKRKVEEVEKSKLELQSQMDDLKHEVIEGKRVQMEM